MSLILNQEDDEQKIAKEKRDQLRASQVGEMIKLARGSAEREGWTEVELMRRVAESAWIAGYHYGSNESYLSELRKKMGVDVHELH